MEPSLPHAYVSQSPDTHREADEMLFALYRAAGPRGRLRKAGALCASARALGLQALRDRHPAASPRELELRLAATYIAPHLVREIWGWAPDPVESSRA
ncbi:MAG: hypothetical protein O2894_01145 [Planctomycetota bacterium]|nr:hypothetical protein [Planctomycetota bacterium]